MSLSLTRRHVLLHMQHHLPCALSSLRFTSSSSTTTTTRSETCDDKNDVTASQIAKLVDEGIAPATGRRLSEIAGEIWDHTSHPVGPGHRSGARILGRALKGPLYASWYPEDPARNPYNPYKLTPKQERWQHKLGMLRAGGKGPPKKGAGKRSK